MAPAPRHLSARSRRIWKAIVDDYDLDREMHSLAVLRLGLEAADRAEAARLQIRRDGLFVSDRYGCIKAHPAERVAKDAAVICARMFRELSLDAGDYTEPRVPRTNGATS